MINMSEPFVRPFLKWPGGKFRLIHYLGAKIQPKNIWVEPFVGAGAVFLNTPAKQFLLNDVNVDLINLYQLLQQEGESFILSAKKHFCQSNNNEQRYYKIRDKFNQCQDPKLRAQLFMFLNRHGYNGLCRYNLSGKYNVPFGDYRKPYFPENEMRLFLKQKSCYKFYNECYSDFFKRLLRSKRLQDMVIYCDPPYAPLSKTANFTGYAANKFTWQEQAHLAELATACAKKGANVFISNHDTPKVRTLYKHATLNTLQVTRSISCNGQSRMKVGELLAHFEAK